MAEIGSVDGQCLFYIFVHPSLGLSTAHIYNATIVKIWIKLEGVTASKLELVQTQKN